MQRRVYLSLLLCGTATGLAACGFALRRAPEFSFKTLFSPLAESQLKPGLRELIEDVLKQDPRPAYADDANRIYGVRLYQYDVKWHCDGQTAFVTALEKTE